MNGDMLLFSDLHLRPETEETCFRVLDGVLEEAKARKVAAIGFLGDFWHLRYQVPVYLLNRVGKWVHEAVKIAKLILLPGNHDQIDEIGENALQIFATHGAHVYTEPCFDEWGAWMPYRKDKGFAAQKLFELQKVAPVLFGHLPVLGALMNNSLADTDGLTPECFLGFQKVVLGHYHKRQSFLDGKVTYVGSPWQTRADEWGQDKGFAIWKHKCGVACPCPVRVLEYIDKIFGRRFHRVQAASAVDLKQQLEVMASQLPGAIRPEDMVQLVMPTQKDLEGAQKVLSKFGLHNVAGSAQDIAVPQPRFGFAKGTTLTQYAQAWAQEKGKEVASFEELMGVWKEIDQ
jgi:DNA repair exonuclease SbcCD nuclease subunit